MSKAYTITEFTIPWRKKKVKPPNKQNPTRKPAHTKWYF